MDALDGGFLDRKRRHRQAISSHQPRPDQRAQGTYPIPGAVSSPGGITQFAYRPSPRRLWAEPTCLKPWPGDHECVTRGPTRRLRHLLDQPPGTDPRQLRTAPGLPAAAEPVPAALTLGELLGQAT